MPVPTAPKVTAPDPDAIVKYWVPDDAAFTGTELKLTVPLPVEVVIATLLFKTTPLVEAKATPEAPAVVIAP